MRIIATIGTTSQNSKVLRELVDLGVDTIRLNFSHFHENSFKGVISECRSYDKKISIMGDLCGRKIRVYENIRDTYKVMANDTVYFCGRDLYEVLINNLNESDILIPLTLESHEIESNDIKAIYIKDGTIKFDIVDKERVFLKAVARDTGIIRAGKGCNIPGINRSGDRLSIKDKEDI